MRALNPRKMADDLRLKKVGKKEFFFYAFVFVVGSISIIPLIFSNATMIAYEPAFLRVIEQIVTALFVIGSFALGYHANKAGDGVDFWYRFVSLSFPIAIVALVLSLVVGAVAATIGVISWEVYQYGDLVLYAMMSVVCVWITWRYMKRASTGM